GGCISCNWDSLLVDQEFGEVPLDVVAEPSSLLRLEILIQGMSILSVDPNLFKDIKLYFVLLKELLDVFRCPWFLVELIGWESQDSESLIFVLVVKVVESRVIAAGKSTVGGHVN